MELEPCPFCGGENVALHSNVGKPCTSDHAWVGCGTCHMDGPEKDSDAEAAAAWNRRTPATKGDENLVEELARAMCIAGGFDPDEIMSNDGPRWKYYVSGIRAILPIVRANQSKPDLSAQLTEAKAGIDYYAGLYAKRCGDLLEAKADAERLAGAGNTVVNELVRLRAIVRGECPSLLDNYDGGSIPDLDGEEAIDAFRAALASYREKHNG